MSNACFYEIAESVVNMFKDNEADEVNKENWQLIQLPSNDAFLSVEVRKTDKDEKQVYAVRKFDDVKDDICIETEDLSVDSLVVAFEKITCENKETTANRSKLNKIFSEIVDVAFTIAVAILISFVITHFIAQRTVVDGYSMYPTLDHNDNIICNKMSYRFSNPERYDIIVIDYEDGYIIKRIIGLPGENVLIDADGNIYINGEILEDDVYGRDVIENAGLAKTGIKLADDEYFVLGDNRNNSADSRVIGPIEKDKIIGKAWRRLMPDFWQSLYD